MYQQREKDFNFVKTILDGRTRIHGANIKLIAPCRVFTSFTTNDGYDNFTNTIGDPMKEETLIVGDEKNNVIVCYEAEDGLRVRDKILDGVKMVPYAEHSEDPAKVRLHKTVRCTQNA